MYKFNIANFELISILAHTFYRFLEIRNYNFIYLFTISFKLNLMKFLANKSDDTITANGSIRLTQKTESHHSQEICLYNGMKLPVHFRCKQFRIPGDCLER